MHPQAVAQVTGVNINAPNQIWKYFTALIR